MEESLFATLPEEFIVRYRPVAGTKYLFSWTQDVNKSKQTFMYNILVYNILVLCMFYA